MKYWVAGKQFRHLCDASEWSWQVCKAWVRSNNAQGVYRVVKVDDSSYGVRDDERGEVMFKEIVGKQ